jgi:hypothetical protein
LNHDDHEDREENIYYGFRGYRSCQNMRGIPSLMRAIFQLGRKPMERPLNAPTHFFFVVFAGSRFKIQSPINAIASFQIACPQRIGNFEGY